MYQKITTMTLSNDTKRIIKEAYGVILRNAFKNDTLNRDIEPLVHFVEKSGFFKARSFSHHHYSGGAAQHCMEVMLWSLEKRHPESIVCGLLLCNSQFLIVSICVIHKRNCCSVGIDVHKVSIVAVTVHIIGSDVVVTCR